MEAITGNPTPAEALLQAAWDENLEQVQGIIGSHISQMLCPHIGTTCAQTWANLRTRFSTPGVSEIAADMYVAYSMKLSLTHNPHPDMERMNMLFEQLNTNGMTFSDMQQGLILLNTILREWSTDTKQTSSKSAPPKASGDVPSNAPKKKTRRGGKGKNAQVHTIVSSALVPPCVTNRLQETHQVAAPVAAPISAPVMASMMVGGPSHAPV